MVTAQALILDMDKKKKNFYDPTNPFIVVRELTAEVILETVKEFLNESENDY